MTKVSSYTTHAKYLFLSLRGALAPKQSHKKRFISSDEIATALSGPRDDKGRAVCMSRGS